MVYESENNLRQRPALYGINNFMSFLDFLFSGLGSKRLEKPFVFITMLISLFFFGTVFVMFVIEYINTGDVGYIAISLIFLLLLIACWYFINRCFD